MVFTCQYNVGQEVELVTLVEVEKSDSLEDGKSLEVVDQVASPSAVWTDSLSI